MRTVVIAPACFNDPTIRKGKPAAPDRVGNPPESQAVRECAARPNHDRFRTSVNKASDDLACARQRVRKIMPIIVTKGTHEERIAFCMMAVGKDIARPRKKRIVENDGVATTTSVQAAGRAAAGDYVDGVFEYWLLRGHFLNRRGLILFSKTGVDGSGEPSYVTSFCNAVRTLATPFALQLRRTALQSRPIRHLPAPRNSIQVQPIAA